MRGVPVSLQRLVITFKPEGVKVCILYRSEDGPNPVTKGRVREATGLVRWGLTAALEALDAGGAEDLGSSGYEVREDTIGVAVARKKGA
jgi:hypothetical protein